ncbi:DUF4190 domain-containing protein [Demequina litorisediminis]|uniref:DUF4190 domain-containing protein n=1 Tax=Demequina litorisediminis TaxID=1849022 RepID=A0ABQ6IH03_9MICO|nr:DUF4190 domain-containing protein [Demequina litorisediminis]GMA35999.1 hypothetical protein GCM10025876_22030 [Demequina litorisediminis]
MSSEPDEYRPAQPASDFVAPRMNPLAVVAIVFAAIGLVGLPPVISSVVGIICGSIAKKQIAASGDDGIGMAKAAVLVGWIGLALVLLVFLFVFVLIATSAAPQ